MYACTCVARWHENVVDHTRDIISRFFIEEILLSNKGFILLFGPYSSESHGSGVYRHVRIESFPTVPKWARSHLCTPSYKRKTLTALFCFRTMVHLCRFGHVTTAETSNVIETSDVPTMMGHCFQSTNSAVQQSAKTEEKTRFFDLRSMEKPPIALI